MAEQKLLPFPFGYRFVVISPHRKYQLIRAFRNMKVTIICLLITVLVLRGTIGAGKFGTPGQDLQEIREHYMLLGKKDPMRVLEEVKSIRQIESRNFLKKETELPNGLSGAYSLGAKITNWDEKRRDAMEKNGYDLQYQNQKIMLVSSAQPDACDNPGGDYWHLKFVKNKIDYSRLHGIEFFYNMVDLDVQMEGSWAKLPVLRMLMLAHHEIEWFFWLDNDAVVTDMFFHIPLEKYSVHNLILSGLKDKIYLQKHWNGLNTGSFLIRNCQWSLDLLDSWAQMGPKGKIRKEYGKILSQYLQDRPDSEADDQSALVYLLVTQRKKWKDKVYLESSYYLQGFWMNLVEKYEEIMVKRNLPGYGDSGKFPFVTHFVGCKPCKGDGDYAAENCLKHMERAFNFADNQILQGLNYVHSSLGSSTVKHLHDPEIRAYSSSN